MHRLALTTALLVVATATALAAPGPQQWARNSSVSVVSNVLSVHSGSVYTTRPSSVLLLDQNTGAKTGTIAAPPTTPFSGQVSFVSEADRSFAAPCGAAATSGVAFYNAHGSMVWQTTFAQHTTAFPTLALVDCSTALFSFADGNVIGQCNKWTGPGVTWTNTTLFALSAKTGAVRWAVALGRPSVPAAAPPVHAATGTIVTAKGRGPADESMTITAFSAKTGAVLWSLAPTSWLDSMSPVSICGDVVIVNAVGVLSGVAVATGEVLWSDDLRTNQSELFSAPRCVLPGAVSTMATSPGASIVFLTNGMLNNKSQTSVSRVGIRSGQVLFSTVLRPGMPIDLTLGVFVDVPNDRVLALLATPSPRGTGTFSTDILTVSTLQLSTGAPKRLTRVSDILFSTITAQVASVSVPSSTSTWLYFTTGTFVWKSPFRANPVVYCRPFE